MKKLLVALSVVSLFAGSAMAETKGPTKNGEITLEGAVVAETCSITADTANQTVKLPAVTVNDFDTNQISNTFKISVEKCTVYEGKTLNVKFAPNPAYVENGILKSRAGKSNVGFKITKDGVNVLAVEDKVAGSVSLNRTLDVNNDPTKLHNFTYTVTYAKTDDAPAKVAQLVAILPFSIEYK